MHKVSETLFLFLSRRTQFPLIVFDVFFLTLQRINNIYIYIPVQYTHTKLT